MAQTSSESQQPPDREPGSSSRGGGRGYEGSTGMPPTGEASPRYPGPVTRLGSTESLSRPTARLLLPSSKHSPFLPRRGFSWPFSKPCDAEGGREVTFKPRHSCSRGGGSGGASVKPRGSIPKPSRRRRGLGAGASPREPPNETLSDYNQPARNQYHRSPCQCHRNTGQKSWPQAPDGGERGLCPPRGHGTSPWPPLPGLPRAPLPARTRHGLAEGTGGARGVFPASPTPFRLFSRSVTALSAGAVEIDAESLWLAMELP